MQHTKRVVEKGPATKKDDLIVITGAGGFIGAILRCTSRKKVSPTSARWTRSRFTNGICTFPGAENICLDVSNETNCHRVCEGAVEVYNLAADMGGMGFIERFRVECLRSILVNTHMVEPPTKPARAATFSPAPPALTIPCCKKIRRFARSGIRRLSGDGRTRLRLGKV